MDNNFIPESDKPEQELPFFEDVSQAAGWGGHTTRKGENELQSEIAAAIGRLGGMVTGWQRGKVGTRDAYQMYYNVQRQSGELMRGRMLIAALPLKTKPRQAGFDAKKKQALKMALYNLRNQLEAAWRMQHLIPGYFALLPFMLHEGVGKTFTEMWVENTDLKNLLPEPSKDGDEPVLEAEFHETND